VQVRLHCTVLIKAELGVAAYILVRLCVPSSICSLDLGAAYIGVRRCPDFDLMTEVGHVASDWSTRTRRGIAAPHWKILNGWELLEPLPEGTTFVVQFTPDYWKPASELSTMRNSMWSVKGRKTPWPSPDVVIDCCEVECTRHDSRGVVSCHRGVWLFRRERVGNVIEIPPTTASVGTRGWHEHLRHSPARCACPQLPVSDLSNWERVVAECGLSETSARSTIRCQTSQAPGAADLPHQVRVRVPAHTTCCASTTSGRTPP